ncbi:MAG: hypothetical protein ACRYGC_07240 [Janthinobacterium lividum]
MPQFDATIKHIKDGLKGFTIAAATKNIEGWEATLEKIDSPAAKAIVKDLENLKKHLHADPIHAEQVRKLVLKLGKETVAIASKTDSKNAEKIKALGEALTSAAESADTGEGDTKSDAKSDTKTGASKDGELHGAAKAAHEAKAGKDADDKPAKK